MGYGQVDPRVIMRQDGRACTAPGYDDGPYQRASSVVHIDVPILRSFSQNRDSCHAELHVCSHDPCLRRRAASERPSRRDASPTRVRHVLVQPAGRVPRQVFSLQALHECLRVGCWQHGGLRARRPGPRLGGVRTASHSTQWGAACEPSAFYFHAAGMTPLRLGQLFPNGPAVPWG